METFQKSGAYHSELVRVTKDGPITIQITSDVNPSKYQGKPDWVGFEFEGNKHTLSIENTFVGDKLQGLKGRWIEITATGRDADADVDVFEVDPPANQRQSRPAPRQQPARQEQSRAQQPAPRQQAPTGIHGATCGMATKLAGDILVHRSQYDSAWFHTPEFPKSLHELASTILRVSAMLEAGKLAPKLGAAPERQPEPERRQAPVREQRQPDPGLDPAEDDIPFAIMWPILIPASLAVQMLFT